MNKNIGKILKESRLSSGISVKAISDILISKGYKASESTIYSWENENSQPTPGAFLVMCDAYGIKNVLTTFGYNGYNEDGSIRLNINEVDIVEKYRALDSHGKKMVDFTLNEEWERSTALAEQSQKMDRGTENKVIPFRIINYYYRLASAGTGQIVFDMPPTKRIEIPNIPKYKRVDYAIEVNGSSMEPVYHDGDTLLVEMTEEIDLGEIGIFLVDNESYVKKLGAGELISLNPEYENIPLTENSKCMGRVINKLTD